MPIADNTPETTKAVEDVAAALALMAKSVGAGKLPASTPLFRACALLCRNADRLYRVVELELSAQLSSKTACSCKPLEPDDMCPEHGYHEPAPAAGESAAVTS
jgi:hypothetical protein